MNNFKFVESYTKISGSSESDPDLVTARKRSLDKVIFSQASVCPRGGSSGQRPPCTVKSGRYASYWNAFLLNSTDSQSYALTIFSMVFNGN